MIDEKGFITGTYRCIPGEWERDANLGGRYSDLKKIGRFVRTKSPKPSSEDSTSSKYEGTVSSSSSKDSERKVGVIKRNNKAIEEKIPVKQSKRYWGARSESTPNDDEPRGGAMVKQTPANTPPTSPPPTLLAKVRQVPGDGNCLFHSVSTCLSFILNGTHVDMHNTTTLRTTSRLLRTRAVDCLSKRPRRILFLQGRECLQADELVEAAAAQYNITGEEYCGLMRKESYWGGGPEIVALCNVLRRPIHVYELTSSVVSGSGVDSDGNSDGSNNGGFEGKKEFELRRMACFGSPKFDRREPLHILSADSRFPDIAPGRQLRSGNHFLALFPTDTTH